MGFLDGVKDRFGIGGRQQQWADPNAYDEYGYEGAEQGEYAYDDGYAPIGGESYEGAQPDAVAFDAYNPDTFKNVSVSTGREPQVAPLAGGYAGMDDGYRSTRTSGRRRSYTSDAVEGATWSTPSDPAFLDNIYGESPSGRDVLDQIGATQSRTSSSDPYSQFDSDIRRIHRDPGAHLEIVKPKVYSDVEKIATAAKAGKSVVLTLAGTKPELAKRILDFSFGVASALNKNVDKADSMVFVISKGAEMLSADEREYLVKKGVLK